MLVPLSLLSLLVGHTVGSTADFVSSGLDKRFLVDLLGQRDLVHPVKSFWHNHKLFRNNHEIRPAHNNHPEPHKGSAKSHKSKAPKKGRKDLSQSNNASSSAMSLFTDMSGKHFFHYWDFFNYPDPTHGNVNYVSQSNAMTKKNALAYVNTAGNVVLSVDSTNKTFNKGQMLVLNAKHMPTGCATWPAFWTVGAGVTWPTGGEIDIVEGVNLNSQNQYTLHTNAGCAINGTVNATSTVLIDDCDVSAYGGANYGCGMRDPSVRSFGARFNQQGGGSYVTLWDDQGIRMWFFLPGSIPADLVANAPDPDANSNAWGLPRAFWPTNTCDNMDAHFTNQTIVINTTLCGDWAGNQGVYNSQCPGTCSDYIASPTHFKQAYWEISSVRIYQ